MLHTFRAGGVILMVGERGSGKSFMVKKLKRDGEMAGMTVAEGVQKEERGETTSPCRPPPGASLHVR